MIRLAKKDGEYFLQFRHSKMIDNNPWWKPWGNDYTFEYEIITAPAVDLDTIDDQDTTNETTSKTTGFSFQKK